MTLLETVEAARQADVAKGRDAIKALIADTPEAPGKLGDRACRVFQQRRTT